MLLSPLISGFWHIANGSSTSITELPGLRSAFSKFATVAISERDDSKSICDNEEAKSGPTAGRPWSTVFQLFVPTIWKMGRNFVFGFVLVFFFTQSQVPQAIIGMGRVIYHIKAFQLRFKRHKIQIHFHSVEKKPVWIFLIFGLISNKYGVSV